MIPSSRTCAYRVRDCRGVPAGKCKEDALLSCRFWRLCYGWGRVRDRGIIVGGLRTVVKFIIASLLPFEDVYFMISSRCLVDGSGAMSMLLYRTRMDESRAFWVGDCYWLLY